MRLSNKMVKKMYENGIIENQLDMEIYRYGIDNGVNILVNLIISLFIAYVLRQQSTLLVFFVSYIPLRAYSGGWHFASKKVCCIVSNVVIGTILLLNETLGKYRIVMIVVMIWAVLYLWISRQKDSVKRCLNSREKDVFNKRKRQCLLITAIGVGVLIRFNMWQYATVLIMATTLTAVLVFLQQRYDKGVIDL